MTKKASGYTQSLTYSTYTGSGYTLYRRSDDTASYGDASNTSYSYTASTARPAVRLEFGVSPATPGIQFADAKVKALCVANWDTNGDGELSEAEAAAITDLGEVFSENTEITSFNELQYFTGLTSIGERSFSDCSSLTSISIPNSVTSIGIGAFAGCGLPSITIPNSVLKIRGAAFMSCRALTSLTIPKSVKSIGDEGFKSIFAECDGLTSIAVESGNTVYDSRDNCNAIIETASNTLVAGCVNTIIPLSVTSIGPSAFDDRSSLTSITIPNSVTSIGKLAFSGCSSLTAVTIPNSVTSIGIYAFYECSSLTSVTIPETVTSIGEYTFYYCSGLKSATIPNSVTSIGGAAFSGCSGLTSFTIPNSVTNIGSGAFQGCRGLTDVYCYAENVPTTSSYAFNNSPISSATLHVPAGSVEAYKTTAPWSGFGTIVAIEDVTLGDLTGDGKVSITDIVMIVDVIAGDITDANQVAAADVNGDGKVSITDCSAAVDLIAAGTSTPSSARKKANAMFSDTDFISGTLHDGLLSIDLEAEHRFTAFQMTVSVPEGMTLGNGSMNAQRGADHLLTVRNLGGGRYLVAGFSADNDELTAGNGCLLTLATEGQADADIVISDIEFATTQAEAYYLADAAVSSTPTGINEMKNEELRVKNEIYDLQGRRVTKATKGIYIYNGKKTMIK